ncbi:MAG: methyl-accepting chemotaxis protein, partial [Syntrophobacteraceae bacterium]
TANLIEGTVKKIKEGSEVVQKTNTEFSEVQTSSARMEELVGEISAASVEQAQGIEQISKAVSEMDKVVQTNSANAEESASASEEMSAQAEQMKQFVGELAIMVGGANGRSTIEGATASLKKVIKEPKIFAAYDKKANGHFRAGDGKASVPLGKRNSGPEQIIPFDDAEVSDF